ncbi:hypothetical protein ACRBEV_25010 [Methylobacterium phyllosphaerae]
MEKIFSTAERLRHALFLAPGAGCLIGSLFRDGGVGMTTPGKVDGRTVGDFIDGLDPFAR